MKETATLTLFAHVVSRPEAEIDLAEAALLIGADEYPTLDVPYYLGMLDHHGRVAGQKLDALGSSSAEDRVLALSSWLYGEAGFHGNTEDYYDPRNSYLNEVLDRGEGIPISLALVFLEVARRVGIEACGISFPGHFLVRAEGNSEPIILDPFVGRVLSRADLTALQKRFTGNAEAGDSRLLDLLQPCGTRHMLFRMLNNLRNVYASKGDRPRMRAVLERMAAIAPTKEICAELEELGGSRVNIRVTSHGTN
jgi:regulator of sirC expression with transglutaminase-like and TPR domain